MNSLQEILKEYENRNKDKKFEKSERAEIVKKFVNKLNNERIVNGYDPISPAFYAVRMADAGLKSESDLYWFYRYCEDAKNFSKCWWWALKNEKNNA